ncbi:MAG: glycosyltransferase family 4 protein [Deltaproteobacteria bacterium]|nr:glycosyltransferase family 4 protein [Deltaproteobacteria bacterium]
MDIALIRKSYTPYGGGEVFLSRFTKELVRKGHICHIFANKWDDGKSEVRGLPPNVSIGGQRSEVGNQNPNIIFHQVKTFGPSFLRILSFAVNSYFAVKKAQLDVIVSFDRTLYQDICRAGDGCHREWLIHREKAWGMGHGAWVRRTIRKVITCLNPLHFTLLYLEKKLFNSKKLKFVIANSNRGKEEIIRHYKLPEEKICVIYNGIDIKKFDLKGKDESRRAFRKRFNISDGAIILLFVGSGFERKGLGFLIKAFGLLKVNGYDNIKLLVVGKGNIKKYFNLALESGIEKDIIFTGPLKSVIDCYYAGDVFCLPSIYEPFSNACLEAMAAGLPVVTSRINGASEILADKEDGMIIEDPANPEEIAEKIIPLLDIDKRNKMGVQARKKAEDYTIEKNVEGFLKLINMTGVK